MSSSGFGPVLRQLGTATSHHNNPVIALALLETRVLQDRIKQPSVLLLERLITHQISVGFYTGVDSVALGRTPRCQ